MSPLRHVLAGLLGLAVGPAAVMVHRLSTAGLPTGAALAVLATLTTALALRFCRRPRLAASFCLGWVVAFGVFVAGRSEGDYAIASDVPGYTLMGVALVLVLVAVTSLGARPSDAAPPSRIAV